MFCVCVVRDLVPSFSVCVCVCTRTPCIFKNAKRALRFFFPLDLPFIVAVEFAPVQIEAGGRAERYCPKAFFRVFSRSSGVSRKHKSCLSF